MITDKDREHAKIICSAIKIPIELSIGGLKIVTTVSTGEILAKLNSETIAQIIYGIRAGSAEQARKDAAERVSSAWLTTECWKDDLTLAVVRMAIRGDSVIKENLTTDHIPDTGKKLAIAVKALEVIRDNALNPAHTMTTLGLEQVTDANRAISDRALKEIHSANLDD